MAYFTCSRSSGAGARSVRRRGAIRLCFTLAALVSACGSSGDDAGEPPGDATNGAAGSASHASPADPRWLGYIRGSQYSRLEFEVDAVAGLQPAGGASEPVLAALARSIDKPDGIALRADGALEPHADSFVWKFDDLDALAQQTFEDRTGSGSIAIHMMFVDGHYEDDGAQGVVLGVAWDHRHVAMFKDNIARSCSSRSTLGLLDPNACQRAEAVVWLHEVGHVLGLVDNGLPMVENHRDPDPAHGRHDADEACVMYWAYDGEAAVDAVLANVLGGRDELGYCLTNQRDLDAAK
jgi:hypothetical protein